MNNNLKTLKVVLEGDKSKLTSVTKSAVEDVRKMTSEINKEVQKAGKMSFPKDTGTMSQLRNMNAMLKKMFQVPGTDALKEAAAGAREYVRNMQIAAGIRVPTDEWQENKQSIENCEQALEKLLAKQEKLRESGADQKLPEAYRRVKDSIEEAESALTKLTRKKGELEESGNGSERTYKYQSLLDSYASEERKLKELIDLKNKWKNQGIQAENMRLLSEDGSLTNIYDEIKSVSEGMGKLKNEISDLEKRGKMLQPTEAMRKLEKEVDKVQSKLGALRSQMTAMNADGISVGTSEWIKNQQEIEKTTQALKELKDEQKQMEDQGQDTRLNIDGSGTVVQLKAIAATAREVISRIPVIGKVARASGSIVSKAFSGMLATLKKIGPAIKSAVGGFAALIQRFSQGIPLLGRFSGGVRQSGSAFGLSLKTMLKYGLGIRILFVLVNRLRSALTEGLTNLANYSQSTNNSLSTLKSGLNQLKNSLATAFAPVLDAVVPILNTLIDYCVAAANAVAHFFAALTGKSSYTVAKRVAVDFASGASAAGSAAGSAADEAERLQRMLMGFDEINKLDDNSSSGGSGGSGGGSGGSGSGDMFATEEVSSAMSDVANEIKAYFQDIFKPMQDAWNTYGEGVINSWKQALNDVISLLKTVAITFKDVWTNGTGEEVCGNILQILQTIGKQISTIATSFKNAWDDGNKGYNYIQSIFNKFNSVLSLINSIGNTLTDVWSNGSGERIIGNILSIFTNINNTISNIARNFRNAWDDGGGTRIIQGIADILDTALGHIRNITASFEGWASNINFSPLLESLGGLVDAVKPLSNKMGEGLEWLFNNVLEPMAKWAIEAGIPAVIDTISAALEALDEVIEAAQPIFGWIWNSFLQPLGEWTGGAIVSILEGLQSAFKGLGDGISSVLTIFEEFSRMFGKTDDETGVNEATMWEKVLKCEVEFTSDGKFIDKDGKEWVKDENGIYHLEGAMDVDSINDNIPETEKTIDGYEAIVSKIEMGDSVVVDAENLQNALGDGWIVEVDAELGIYKNNITGDFLAKDSSGNLRIATSIKSDVDVQNLKNTANKTVGAGVDATGFNANGKFASMPVLASGFNANGKSALTQVLASGFNANGRSAYTGIFATGFNANGKSASARILATGFNANGKNASTKINATSFNANGKTASTKIKITGQSNTPTVSVKARITGTYGKALRMATGGLFSGGKWKPITAAASGGSFSTGQMFIAREAGPELVGRIGSGTAVMNNNQIVASVSAGVYQAVVAAMSQFGGKNGSGSTPVFNIYVGGRQITDVVVEQVNQQTIATGSCPILT